LLPVLEIKKIELAGFHSGISQGDSPGKPLPRNIPFRSAISIGT